MAPDARAVMVRRLALAAVAWLLVSLIGASMADAAPGDLDPTFGSGGVVATPVGGFAMANALILQPDGKLVIAGASGGGFTLARYNPGGSVDTSFGSGGIVQTQINTGTGWCDNGATSLVFQPDGKLVAAGYHSSNCTYHAFALARYNSDGSLDTTFGSSGTVVTQPNSMGGDAEVYSLALQADGKLVAAGYSNPGAPEFALARYNANGTLDKTFGSGGIVLTPLGSGAYGDLVAVKALAVQGDGKVVAAGHALDGGDFKFALARYNADGSLDTDFGSTGTVLTPIIFGAHATALALLGDGKLVATGYAHDQNYYGPALARYNPDGSLDTSFGSAGTVWTPMVGGDLPSSLAVTRDGKLLLAGVNIADGNVSRFALTRYDSGGSLDASFGANGIALTPTGGVLNVSSLVIQADGKPVVAGSASDNTTEKLMLARFQGDLFAQQHGVPNLPQREVARAAVRRLDVIPRAFRAAPSGPSALATKAHTRRKYGARVRFDLNVSARVRFGVERVRRARKCKRGRSLTESRRVHRCDRSIVLRGFFTRDGRAGGNSFRFTGRLAGRKLKRGHYRLVATPNAARSSGPAAEAAFRIVG